MRGDALVVAAGLQIWQCVLEQRDRDVRTGGREGGGGDVGRPLAHEQGLDQGVRGGLGSTDVVPLVEAAAGSDFQGGERVTTETWLFCGLCPWDCAAMRK
ncbi:MAG TPA: hypothetical protein VMV07_24460 [Streptosporangiaceae bacterium]|nr:hypothetical protein [Streptosporangiaceae bacterium]